MRAQRAGRGGVKPWGRERSEAGGGWLGNKLLGRERRGPFRHAPTQGRPDILIKCAARVFLDGARAKTYEAEPESESESAVCD